MRIGIDIDNCISNFDDTLLKEYLKHDKELRNTGIINESPEYLRKGMFDWTEEEKSFYNANIEEFVKKLKPLEDSSYYIKKLKEDGHEIYIITGRNNGEYTNPSELTKEWLAKYDIVYDRLIFTNAYDKHAKTEVCLKNNIDLMIEDSTRDNNISIEEGTEKSYDEIIKICNWLNFDYTNKVFKGSTDYIVNDYNEKNDAVNKIIEIANKNDKTYILAIGAITNVALAIKKEPKIVDKIEVIWLGGHSFLNKDNKEFNFKQDVQAVKTVFESKVKLTIIPCKNVASNLRTSIYELEHFLKGKSELCDYLYQRFYNDGVFGIQERRVIWDISVIAYIINKEWFETEEISCPNINDDTSYELTENNHTITVVNYLNVDEIYKDLFRKLGERL